MSLMYKTTVFYVFSRAYEKQQAEHRTARFSASLWLTMKGGAVISTRYGI
jgi:hypothetical protein